MKKEKKEGGRKEVKEKKRFAEKTYHPPEKPSLASPCSAFQNSFFKIIDGGVIFTEM